MIAVIIEESRDIDAGTLAKFDSLASAVAARVDGSSPSVGIKWPSGSVSYAPKGALRTLAGTLTKSAAGTILFARDAEGRTFAEWETFATSAKEDPQPRASWGRIALTGTEYGFQTAVIPLERGIELASEPGKVADKADQFIEELGLRAKPKKPNDLERLAAREAKLATQEADLSYSTARASQLARLDTSALDRAGKLYSERRTDLRDIAREMLTASDHPGSHFQVMLVTFSPTMPGTLVKSALDVAKIPQAHNVKRMAAAIAWHEEASTWVDIISGEKPGKWRRCARLTYRSWAAGHKGEITVSPTRVKEEFARVAGWNLSPTGRWHVNTDAVYSLGSLRGRLDVQRNARNARATLPDLQADLYKTRTDLALVRVKLQQKGVKAQPIDQP